MTTVDAALDYLKRRILCVDVPFKSKVPIFEGWQLSRFDTPQKIQSRFNCAPQNLGILNGGPSDGLVDLDLDFLEARIIADAFAPDTATSGRLGKPYSHRWYYPEPLPATKQFQFGDDMVVEVRSTGTQTIAPPSTHPSGEQVLWQKEIPVARVDGTELLRLAGIVAAGALLARHWPKTNGIRDQLAMALAGGLLRADWSVSEAERFILAVCRAAGDEEASERVQKARHTNNKIDSDKPTTGWRTLSEFLDRSVVDKAREWLGATLGATHTLNLTELGNARRLSKKKGEDLRFVHLRKRWINFTGTHWQVDETGHAFRCAKEVIKGLYDEAAQASDKDDRKSLATHATRSESDSKIRAMLSLAESEPEIAITPDHLDRDPMLLNCLNGTIDLKTGRLRPHHRADFITKLIPIEYDPDALCPLWDLTLTQIFAGKPALIDFLQRAVGYSLTGLTLEQVIFILWGSGANGKSTIIEILRALLGDYARQIPADSLMIRKTDSGQSNDVASLKGARIASASECEEGQRLAEARIKAWTGGDTVAARFLYGEYFEFRPEFKLWLATNSKPTIRGTNDAIWRRVRLIPFTVTFTPDKQDKELSQKLRSELAGILSWAIRGCMEWQRSGLGTPDEVEQATAGYKSEMDIVALFIEDCCVQKPNVEAKAKYLYQAFLRWAEENSERKFSQRAFGLKLTEKGFDHYHTRDGWKWIGLGLLETTA